METETNANVSIYRALVAAQKRAEAVEKDATNTFHKYKYASAEAIIAEARQALALEGLSVFTVSVDRDPSQLDHEWESTPFTNDKGQPDVDNWIKVPRRIRVVYRLLHESGDSMEFSSTAPVIPEKGRPEDKAEFGARTENLGYALRDLLLLPRVNESSPVPSARDDRDSRPRGPAPAAASTLAAKPVTERPWMKRLQGAVGKLNLGIGEADTRGLKGKPRDEFERAARVDYLRWCAGRMEIKSTLDLTDAEAAVVIQRAEAGDVPE